MPIDIIELKWRCCHCQVEVLGRHEQCPNCGHTKCDNCKEIDVDDPGPGGGTKDPELVKLFSEGADWVCKFCGSHERKSTGECNVCGAAEDQGVSRDDKDEAPLKAAAMVYMKKPFPSKRKHYRSPPEKEPGPDPWPPQVVDRSGGRKPFEPIDDDVRKFRGDGTGLAVAKVILAFCGAVGLGFLIFLLFRTRVVEAVVLRLHWQQVIVVDRNTIHHHDGFEESRPSDSFNVRDEGRRVHHYDKVFDHNERSSHTRQVPDGQTCRESCYTTSRNCSNNKNGSKTCSGGDRVCSQQCTPKTRSESYTTEDPVYRDEPVYRMYYSWDRWEWSENRRVIAQGYTTELHWPPPEEVSLNINLSEGENERFHQEALYEVTFKGEGEEFKFEPKTPDDFQRYKMGAKYQLKVGVAHGVEVLRH